jgi:hypothetical protein
VNIIFQLCWNIIFVFVIVGLDPTIQAFSDNLAGDEGVVIFRIGEQKS